MKHKEAECTLLIPTKNVEQVAQEPVDLGNCFLEDPYPDPLERLMKHEQILLYPFQNGTTTRNNHTNSRFIS